MALAADKVRAALVAGLRLARAVTVVKRSLGREVPPARRSSAHVASEVPQSLGRVADAESRARLSWALAALVGLVVQQ